MSAVEIKLASVCVNMNLLCVACLLLEKEKHKLKKQKKRYSAKWLLKRNSEGFSHKLLKEILDEDTRLYKTILRMTPTQFQFILDRVSPFISKQDTNFRNCISAAERLQVTLMYLATGKNNCADNKENNAYW